MKKQLLIYFILLITMNMAAQSKTMSISYYVSMDKPSTHYFDVSMQIDNIDANTDTLELKMATWTPGSYLIREFSRKVEAVQAIDDAGNALAIEKVSKNTWRMPTKGINKVNINYSVYSYELSVRTCYLTKDFGYINAASLLWYIADKQNLPATLYISPYSGWKKLATSLPKEQKADGSWVLQSPNFDILADSPILIGNFELDSFEAAGIPHYLAVAGGGNHNTERIIADIQKIAQAQTDMFGENPCEDYTVIQINTDATYGGLEHLSSTSLMFPRWNFDEKNYNRWEGLMSHEYFHLWNVKRLRPIALGPFDYENENYTYSLWEAEGFTSYYDDYMLLRAGLTDAEQYLEVVAKNIGSTEGRPGKAVQSVAEASFDAWVKYYRQDENSRNSNVSYYVRGAVLATLLNLEILNNTKGQKSLDDVMRLMYNKYYKELGRGFTEAELKESIEEVAAKDLSSFFDNYIYGTTQINYEPYLNYAGLRLVEEQSENKSLSLGIYANSAAGGVTIKELADDGDAAKANLKIDDEILSINNYFVTKVDDYNNVLSTLQKGETVSLKISRSGNLQDVTFVFNDVESAGLTVDKSENGSLNIRRINRGACGYESGLSVDDKIVAINNSRIRNNDELKAAINANNIGDKITVWTVCWGRLTPVSVTLSESGSNKYKIEKLKKANRQQKMVYKTWLGADF